MHLALILRTQVPQPCALGSGARVLGASSLPFLFCHGRCSEQICGSSFLRCPNQQSSNRTQGSCRVLIYFRFFSRALRDVCVSETRPVAGAGMIVGITPAVLSDGGTRLWSPPSELGLEGGIEVVYTCAHARCVGQGSGWSWGEARLLTSQHNSPDC